MWSKYRKNYYILSIIFHKPTIPQTAAKVRKYYSPYSNQQLQILLKISSQRSEFLTLLIGPYITVLLHSYVTIGLIKVVHMYNIKVMLFCNRLKVSDFRRIGCKLDLNAH